MKKSSWGANKFLFCGRNVVSRARDWRGGGAVPKRSGGMKRKRNPGKPGFCASKNAPGSALKNRLTVDFYRVNVIVFYNSITSLEDFVKGTKIIAVAAIVACFGTGSVFAKKAKDQKVKIEIVNRPGMALGTDIPGWVEAVLEGDNKEIAKSLKIDLKEKQIFVFSNQGDDLEFLKTWTDQVDVQRQVANSFSIAVGQSANAVLQGNSGSESAMQRSIDQTVKALSALELNGLLKDAQYWIQFKKPKQGVKITKKSPDSAFDYYYEYYVIFTMDRNIYDSQLEAALNGVEDNASETKLLKEALSENLRAPLVDKVVDTTVEYDW